MEDEISLIEVWKTLRKRKKIVLRVFLFIVLLTLVFSSLQPKLYQATTTLLPPIEEKTSLGNYAQLSSTMGIDLPNSKNGLDYVSLLKSRAIAEKLVNFFYLYPKEKKMQKRIDALLRASIIESDTKSKLITIKVEYSDPVKATNIANQYPIFLNEYILNNNLTQAKQNRIFIEGRVKEIRKTMEKAENELKEYQTKSGLIMLEDQSKKAIEDLSTLRSQLIDTKAELVSVGASLEQSKKQLEGQTRMQLSQTSFSANPVVQQLKIQLAQNETEMAGLTQKYTENYPDVISKKAIIEKIKKELKEEIDKTYSGESYQANPVFQMIKSSLVEYQVKFFALQAKKVALENIIAEVNEQVNELPSKGLVFNQLEREVDLQNQLYSMVMQQYEMARINEAKTLPVVQVLDKAYFPENPSSPKFILNLIIGGLLGLLLGGVLALILDFMDKNEENLVKM